MAAAAAAGGAAPPFNGSHQQQQQPLPYAAAAPYHQHQQNQQQQQQRWIRDMPSLSPGHQALLAANNVLTARDALLQTPLDLCERLNVPLSTATAILQAVALEAAPSFTTALELHTTLHQHSVKLLTGLPVLDAALRIGVPPAAITELVGPAGVGKSQFCYSLALQAAMPVALGGLAATLIYIDTEGKFSTERLREMAAARVAAAAAAAPPAAAAAGCEAAAGVEVVEQVLNRMLVMRAHSPEELQGQLGHLATMVPQRDVKLVILDSVAALLRTAELGGGGGGGASSSSADGPAALAARGELLGQQAGTLKAVAEASRIPVVVTNQVTARMSGPAVHAFQQQPLQPLQQQEGGVSAALGTKWAHAVNVRLVLERHGDRRVVTIAKSPLSVNVAVDYQISAAGVEQAAQQDVGTAGGQG